MKVRTRFAPSPTGYMHIGNLRTALYTWLLARHNDGDFILRIEDTDQQRLVDGAVDVIYQSLRTAGLDWDEGPDKDKGYGPYVQSERKPLYAPLAWELVEKGHAYPCFCPKERLDGLREEYEKRGDTFKYDKHCLPIPLKEAKARIAAGEEYVIRQNIPTTGVSGFHDVIFGDIEADNNALDDNVLLKSDGLPTYNFANVVDDHLMGITHIMRGSEYLSSTPKYNLLYEAFGWEKPVYIHLSAIMANAQRKMSKRHGDPSFEDLLQQGFLVDAVINYIALLGWSPGTDQEFFTLAELVEAFDLRGLSKSPAVFDIQKLTYFNGMYIRNLPLEQFHALVLPHFAKVIDSGSMDTLRLAGLLQARCEVLPDVVEKIDFLAALPEYDMELFTNAKQKTDRVSALETLTDLLPRIEGLPQWSEESVGQAVGTYIAEKGVKNGPVLWPLRIAIAGKQNTPGGAYEIAGLLGRDETLRRLRTSMDRLRQ